MTANRYILFLVIALMVSLFIFCRTPVVVNKTDSVYLNHNDTVAYIGSESCKACHLDKFETFMHTGMGESFDIATKQKSASIIDKHTLIFDSINNYYYKPFWRNDSLLVKEFRLKNKDTIFQRIEHIKYIIGSGHHTNSHIYEKNGYLYQAPITFYTQQKIWDFAPGFAAGFNNRFDRLIGTECMNCHNSFCEQPKGAENKYDWVADGIGCERCHGPGEVHLKLKTDGEVIDTATQIDYSIVNPAKLNRTAQMQVCMRCHVQGISILKEEHTFYDFKPGQALDTIMEVFLPRYQGANTKFIMASQADRLMQSACYKNTDMTCITCHNPHISTRITSIEYFNKKCQSCHTENATTDCTLAIEERSKKDNNCSACHMPESPSIDIPNVTVTDHLIRVQPTAKEKQQAAGFSHLQSIVSAKADPALKALGYLSFYEKFTENEAFLDSVELLLKQTNQHPQKAYEAQVWLNFIQGKHQQNTQLVLNNSSNKIADAWTTYRLAASFEAINQLDNAVKYYKQAVDLQQFNLDFVNKYGAALVKVNNFYKAKEVLEFLIKENDQHLSGLTNLGFVYLNLGLINKASEMYNKALYLNPDYIPALMNKIGLCMVNKDKQQAQKLLNRVVEIDPKNTKAKQLLNQLNAL